MLATDVELQGWLREEIKSVFGVEENLEKWNYEKAFPQLKRCLAIMVSFGLQLCIIFTSAVKNAKQILQFETLRLYGPVFYIPRYAAQSFQHLNIRGKEYPIPPHPHVHLNTAALHTLFPFEVSGRVEKSLALLFI
jgi:hypothetical protein